MSNDKPLAIDLFCGLGGWSDGLIAEGWRVIGYDIERHEYGDQKYPGELVLQDVLTIHGSQFKDADLIVASPPCQEYSYMAMPWSRAKAIAAEYHSGKRDVKKLTALFDACFRIQREASEAAGRYIPMVLENVRGAQPWVGKARWNFGSYYLWGDVPALMPITQKALKVPGFRFDGSGGSFQTAAVEHSGQKHPAGNCAPIMWKDREIARLAHPTVEEFSKLSAHLETGFKSEGMNWSDQTKRGQDFTRLAGEHCGQKVVSESGRRTDVGKGARFTSRDCGLEGLKQPGISGPRQNGKGDRWFQDGAAQHKSKSNARKAASALIAKIPFPLSSWIARVMKPRPGGF